MNKFVWSAIIIVFLVPLFVGPVRGWIHMLRSNDGINNPELSKRNIGASKGTALKKNTRIVRQKDSPKTLSVTERKNNIRDEISNYDLGTKKDNKDIQRALKNAGFYTGKIDGVVGMGTRRAIKAFQEAKGLGVDGVVGSKTWGELKKFLKE